tara:strand:+ start:1961 stop:2080 length:120 start_codon:yes stop_codon:yes gene_type:complete
MSELWQLGINNPNHFGDFVIVINNQEKFGPDGPVLSIYR